VSDMYQLPAPPVAGVGRPLMCRTEEIRPHPAYAQLGVEPSTRKLSILAQRGVLAFQEPLIITQDRILVDGYARWRLAQAQQRGELLCVEHDWSPDKALIHLLQLHSRNEGLIDFVRVVLTLQLEPLFQARARANQQAGGQLKGSIDLSEAVRLDVRDKLATIAGVSPCYISRVKKVQKTSHPDVLEALRTGEIKINKAWRWSSASHAKQLESLQEFRTKKAIKSTIRKLISKHRSRQKPLDLRADHLLSILSLLPHDDLCVVETHAIKSPGRMLFISNDLLEDLERQFSFASVAHHAD
jgi:hypothetical protein